jgi:hypothetical protein
VHYRGLDRRLDDWVGRERLLAPIERRRVSGRPRGIKELVGLRASYNNLVVGPNATVSPAADNGLDERTLKAHEAETKVKNVRSVVLGGFSMDAWYYSPFPCVPVRTPLLSTARPRRAPVRARAASARRGCPKRGARG